MTTLDNVHPRPAHLDWMAQTPHLAPLRIDELILPGTHNSGSDKLSPNLGLPQELAQDVAPFEQMRQGIRVLDLRVSFYGKHPKGDPRRFQLFHLSSSGRTIAVDIIERVLDFYRELEASGTAARDIIILDFHQFDGFTPQAHQELQALLSDRLRQRLLPRASSTLTLKEIWRNHPGKNVVLAYAHTTPSDDFWRGVSQRWPGENLFNTNTLKAFINEVAAEYKPVHSLVAVQCAKYSLPLHAPTDLSHKVDQWFESVDENSFIQNFFIINTDWSLRSGLVANCRHANRIRAQHKARHPDRPLQPMRRAVSSV